MQPLLLDFHVSGDIPDADYLLHMVSIAQRNPHCEILCFTKKFSMVKNIKDRRKNIYRCAQLVKAGKMTRAKADELFTSWLAHATKGDNPHAIERMKKYYLQCMEG